MAALTWGKESLTGPWDCCRRERVQSLIGSRKALESGNPKDGSEEGGCRLSKWDLLG